MSDMTQAGRDLLTDPSINGHISWHPHPRNIVDCWLCDRILAIEVEATREAVEKERYRVRIGVMALPTIEPFGLPNVWRGAVLALLAPSEPKEDGAPAWFCPKCGPGSDCGAPHA
jgi:hypothetical protein